LGYSFYYQAIFYSFDDKKLFLQMKIFSYYPKIVFTVTLQNIISSWNKVLQITLNVLHILRQMRNEQLRYAKLCVTCTKNLFTELRYEWWIWRVFCSKYIKLPLDILYKTSKVFLYLLKMNDTLIYIVRNKLTSYSFLLYKIERFD